ncbi:MAG: radical SAM protein, partial [Clostridia bacterium]|nr:radical SAM protein [Clostridia bacterium]
LPEVLKSIRILNHEEGQKIGIRRITVSTCGLVPQIESLAEENIDIVLAVSLHAPNDKLRNEIMPVNKQYPLGKLINSCRRYIEKTGRRVTFEYALLKGFNDNMEQVVELSTLLRGIKANINVIPINTVSDGAFNKPSSEKIKKFVVALREKGLDVVIREEKGSDIEAACGQLAGSIM